jgi:hypothetical protein
MKRVVSLLAAVAATAVLAVPGLGVATATGTTPSPAHLCPPVC